MTPTLEPQLRRRLVEESRDELTKLEALLDRDLSAWRDPNPRQKAVADLVLAMPAGSGGFRGEEQCRQHLEITRLP